MGRDPHGVPAGLDRDLARSHLWPMGRGREQHPWEPPRSCLSVLQHRARLRSLGDSCSPQQAALAFSVLWRRLFGGMGP
jgi:hypothetical protein